jgi:glycogen operon protein
VHGPWRPQDGHRCCGAKLLVDPYARVLDGDIEWNDAFYPSGEGDDHAAMNLADNAHFAPRCVVAPEPQVQAGVERPRTPLETIIYELHVKGFTETHPLIPPELRGTYAGLAHPVALTHLRELGVTAVELMPVQHFVHRRFMLQRGLRNFWGYDPIQYFALQREYASHPTPLGALTEFREMVRAFTRGNRSHHGRRVQPHRRGRRAAMLCFKASTTPRTTARRTATAALSQHHRRTT